MELRMINVIYVAFPMREQTEKTTFASKDDKGKFLHVYQSGAKELIKNQDRTRPELTQP